MEEERKVSSEKDVVEKPKRQYKKRVKEEAPVETIVQSSAADSVVDDLRAQIAKLRAELAQKDVETKRLLELSEKALDGADPKDNKTVMVKCLEINGVQLSSPNRDVIITLPYDTWVECESSELSQVFKRLSNRTLFEDGICIMEDGALEKFRIKARNHIDFDEIVDLLNNGNEVKIRAKLDELTLNKKKNSVMHLILYTIVGKSLDGEISRVPRASLETLEDYFGVKMKDVEMLLKIFRKVKE